MWVRTEDLAWNSLKRPSGIYLFDFCYLQAEESEWIKLFKKWRNQCLGDKFFSFLNFKAPYTGKTVYFTIGATFVRNMHLLDELATWVCWLTCVKCYLKYWTASHSRSVRAGWRSARGRSARMLLPHDLEAPVCSVDKLANCILRLQSSNPDGPHTLLHIQHMHVL